MQKRKKFNLSNFFKKSNVKRFFIFLIIAFVFLIFSKLSNTYKQNVKLKINLVQLDDEIRLQNDSLNYVTAYIEANGFALIPWFFKATKKLKIDAKEDVLKEADQYIFDVEKHKYLIAEQLGKSYNLISVKPNTLILPYSKIATKYVPVNIKTEISYASGFDLLDEFKINLDSVKIVGSASNIDSISSFDTDLLKLEDVKNNINQSVDINTTQYKDIEVFPKSVVVTGSVERFTEGQVEVPVAIINKPSGIVVNYFPKTLNVTYYVSLDRFNVIKPSDFIVECDFAKLKENQNFLIPEIVRKPKFVKRASLKQKRIDFIEL